ncbi:MAG TPA: universal stress protein [Acidimicrobiales bacterium]|nr:universal stress protein [Acidimicrobiales bacterium]
MTKVIAAIDNSLAARPVVLMATALAEVLGATVEPLHVSDDDGETARACADSLGLELRRCSGDPLECIRAAAEADDVVAVAIGARQQPSGHHVGHLARQVADVIDKPVLVVPPETVPPAHLHHVVIAMEGTPAKTRHLKAAVDVASSADLHLTVVHVDDESSIPSFSDQVAHETDAYAHEFLARYLHGAPRARLELRIGAPADEVIDVTDVAAPDLLAIGWPQSAGGDHGATAREILDRSHVPVLLVAIDSAETS